MKSICRVLVTGAAGFIGSWTVEELVREGYYVVGVDDLSDGSLSRLNSVMGCRSFQFIKASVCDWETMMSICRDVDAVIHLAAKVSVEEAHLNPKLAFKVNVEGTLVLLEASRKGSVERFVYASSVAVYGEPRSLPVSEDHPLKPVNVYGATKAAAESLVHSYHTSYGLSTVALRYFNVYGPRMKRGYYAGVVAKFIERVLSNKPPVIFGDGNQTRDFIYVRDVVRANILALKSKCTGAFNIGTGVQTSINRLCNMILKLMGREDLKPIYDKPRPGDVRFSQADIGRAVRELGWKPEYSLERGLRETISYYVKHSTV